MTITTTAYSVTDDFSTDTSASYTNTINDSGTAAAWTFDTANNRLVGNGGADGVLLYTSFSVLNGYIEIQTDQLRSNGGIVFRHPDNNHTYVIYCNDSASGTSPNTINVEVINAGGYNNLGSASISFPTGTLHTIRLTVCYRDASVLFDGAVKACFAFSDDFGAGLCGLDNGNGGTNHFQKMTIVDLEKAPLNPVNKPSDKFFLYDSHDITNADTSARLATIAAGGFKTILNYSILGGTFGQSGPYGSPHISDVISYINTAHSYGMKVIVSLVDLSIWQTPAIAANFPNLYADSGNQATTQGFDTYIVNQTKNLAGTWGYYAMDEPSDTSHAAGLSHFGYIQAAAPSLPVLLICAGHQGATNFAGFNTPYFDCCTVGGDDWYPLGDLAADFTAAGITVNGNAFLTLKGKNQSIILQAWQQNGVTPGYADFVGWIKTVETYMSPQLIGFYSYDQLLLASNPTLLWSNLTRAIKGGSQQTIGNHRSFARIV